MNPFEDYSQVVDSSAVAMFSIKKLSWDKSSLRSSKTGKSKVISQLAANNGMVFAATNACTVVRWNLADGSRTSDLIDVSNRSDDSIEHVFTDPTGSHAVISMKSLDNYYLHSRQIKPKKLSKLQGVIKCACFDKAQTSDASAKFLVGTSIGAIYEVLIDSSGKEKFCQQVYQVTENIPITSIHFEPLPTGGSNRSGKTGEFTNKYLVMCATSSPTRLYHFIGGPTFQALFAAYSNTNASPFTELPGEIPKAELYCFRGTQSNLVQNFALTTEMGIYHGTVQFKESSTPESDNVWLEAQLLPMNDQAESDAKVKSIAVTEFHFIVLRDEYLEVYCRLNGQQVQSERISMTCGTPIGLFKDCSRNLIWLYTDIEIFQILVYNEDRDIWSISLAKALQGDTDMFKYALENCKTKEQTQIVNQQQAEYYLLRKETKLAAETFARSGLPFEEVALKLISSMKISATKEDKSQPISSAFCLSSEPEDYDSLRIYMLELLKVLPTSAKSQRTMLATWITEIYLHSIYASNYVDDQKADVTNQLKAFLRTNRTVVDVPTIINLVVQRDDRNILQFVAQVAGDYGKVIGLLMTERRHSDIIAIFEDTPFEKISSLLYKTLPVLIEFEPEATVQLMLNKAQLSLTGVLPTLFGYCSAVDKLGNSSAKSVLTTDYSGKRIHYAIYYLCQRLQSSSHFSDIALLDGISVLEEHTDLPEPQLVHTLIGMLAKYEADEVKMIAIIQKIIDLIELEILTENSNRYDYEYIMRQCRLHHKIRGGVLCWILLGSLESAVREALNVDIDMAKNIIKNCKSASNPRSLWFLVAQHALEGENDAQKAIDLITESDSILSIDDLLPLFDDATDIGSLKDEICQTLEVCGSQINNLKCEMDELAESSESTVKELEDMKSRAYCLSSQSQICEYCCTCMLGDQFYLFPCSHGFHTNCLLKQAHINLDKSQLSALQGIESSLKALEYRVKDDMRAKQQQDALQMELDGYLAGDCPLCGYVMIRLLGEPLIESEDSEEAKSWEI